MYPFGYRIYQGKEKEEKFVKMDLKDKNQQL